MLEIASSGMKPVMSHQRKERNDNGNFSQILSVPFQTYLLV